MSQKKRLLTGFVLAMVLAISSFGCATVKGEKYTSKNLPPSYIAGARENPQTVDLTRLASTARKSDVLDRGDVVEVVIAAGLNEKDTIRLPLRIEEDGYASIPEIGRVKLAGLKLEAAEAAIVYECVDKGLYRNPNVTMTMKSQRTNRIVVMGAVKKPSTYHLPRGQCDLLSAISEADGLDQNAGTQVVIRNPGNFAGDGASKVAKVVTDDIEAVNHLETSDDGTVGGHSIEMAGSATDTVTVDLVSATKNGTGGFQLEDGAVVYVERRDPEPLHVTGLVTRAGRFEFPIAEEVRVLDAIALAGGTSSLGANKVYVIRRKPGSEMHPIDPQNPDKVQTFIIQTSLANAKQKADSNIRLQPGDVVSVEQTPLTFTLDLFKRIGMNVGGSFPLVGTPLF